jgi:hypothetical protein
MRSASLSDTILATMSGVDPGAKATMTWTGLAGQSSAKANGAARTKDAASRLPRNFLRFMQVSRNQIHCGPR